MFSRTRSGWSGPSVNWRIPPPWQRTRAPVEDSAARSLRAVTAEVLNRLLISWTVTRPLRSNRLRISWRLSSTESWPWGLVDIYSLSRVLILQQLGILGKPFLSFAFFIRCMMVTLAAASGVGCQRAADCQSVRLTEAVLP